MKIPCWRQCTGSSPVGGTKAHTIDVLWQEFYRMCLFYFQVPIAIHVNFTAEDNSAIKSVSDS